MFKSKFYILECYDTPPKLLGLFITVILIVYNSSCKRLVGYKAIEKVDSAQIQAVCQRHQVADCFQMDLGYIERVKQHFSDSLERKNMLQPLQVHYFTGGMLQSSLINCYAPGIIHLQWNTDNRFAVFPPKPHFRFKKEISIVVFEKLLSIKSNNQQDIIFIFWSNILKNKSEELIELVKKHNENAGKKSAISLVNIDSIYSKNSIIKL